MSDTEDIDDLLNSSANNQSELNEDGEIDDIEDDEEEEDEEDDEEEDERGPKKRTKTKRKQGVARFLDTEVAVDDDDEEEDEDDYDQAEEGFTETNEEVQSGTHRELNRSFLEADNFNAEEYAQTLEERHRGYTRRARKLESTSDTPQQLLLPGLEDPSLWLVRCRRGKEREAVLQITRKFFSTPNLEIFGVFARDNAPGIIYVEAKKLSHVQTAITNVNLVNSNAKIALVQVGEMVDCVTIRKNVEVIVPGSWVRLKRGIYAGDLGKVIGVSGSGEEADVLVLPRLEKQNGDAMDEDKKRKKTTIRPKAQRLTDEDIRFYRQRNHPDPNGNIQIHNIGKITPQGFLLKTVKANALDTKDVNPTLEERTEFDADGVDAKDVAVGTVQEEFEVGDRVEIMKGELTGLTGSLSRIMENVVELIPDDKFNLGLTKVSVKDIKKKFEPGNHVRVLRGMFRDEQGMIVNIKNNIVTLLSDGTHKEIEVFSRDLRAVSETSATSNLMSGRFDVFDLVFLPNKEAAIVLRTTKDMISLLTQHNQQLRLPPQQLEPSREQRPIEAVDMNGAKIKKGDTVLVSEPGSNIKKRATILYVHKTFVFLRSREVLENSGVLVSKTSMVSSLKGGNVQRNGHGNGDTFDRGGRGRGRGGRGGFNRIISRNVQITAGPYKGYMGIVKDVSDNGARIELHTTCQTVTVDQTKLNIVGENGQLTPASNFSSSGFTVPVSSGRIDNGGKTPMYSGSKTPMHRPMDGSKTPAWDIGSKTPAWDISSKTPNPYDGGRTPAWDVGSKTPNPYDGGRTPAWDVGSRTPAWSGGRTPRSNWDGGFGNDNETPRNPETPAYANPSTPGVSSLSANNRSTTSTARNTSELGGNRNNRSNFASTPLHPTTPYNPATPLNPDTPFIPTTPYSGGTDERPNQAQSNVGRNWVTEEIEVSISEKYRPGEFGGKQAVIVSASNRNAPQIRLLNGQNQAVGETVSIPVEHLERVKPAKKDRLVLLPFASEGGARIYGVMVSAMMDDVVVRLDDGTHHMYPMNQLGKVVATN
ncbi:transcription elongation factor spt5 [Nowakowskiella sp. JEL0407]|nr:transcription elongation factor spt5 [Nowakowskiella sp. JEL0407]